MENPKLAMNMPEAEAPDLVGARSGAAPGGWERQPIIHQAFSRVVLDSGFRQNFNEISPGL
jgi:hypothetical protein